ncbi:MAG: D-lyxose/D-mannose family sugar isomerase [Actinomycetota bacterium]
MALTRAQIEASQQWTARQFDEAGIVLTPEERGRIEVSDFRRGELERTGLQLLVYVNTDRVCAKEIVLLPFQTCPEHRHVSVGSEQGKEETFRCRRGTVYLYVEGEPTVDPLATPSRLDRGVFTAWHEIVLHAGDQHTIYPDTLHWFQAGPEGAIVTEFSTRSTDEYDVFTDPDVRRMTVVTDS